uniref:Leukotriene-B4 20-monooxygenase n=1 Tax=Tetraselmis sp. GSL018 TaxID=582737 RepID=A0A061S1E3_9CHLO|mmetsp:Transcript_36050/g.85540  ORF Transcript_36050/g.85540 Transcript_36050/m.85540 type:complete len:544 (-) Transcript_36050:320-1951(-)
MAVNGSFSCILQPNTCRPRTCSVRNYGNEPCFILRRHKGRPVLVQASATTDSVAAAKPPEKMRGALPVVGNFHQFKFSKLYKDIDDFHKQHDSQALEVSMFRRRSCHTRDPNDCAQIFRDAEVFPKSPDINVVSDWLGEGLATQSNIQKHAEMRRLLNPAFRQDYIKGLSPAFAEVGDRLADALLELGEHDIQDMAARATIDIIGRTGFRYDFGCLDLAMGRRRSGATVEAAGERLDVAKLFDQLVFGVSRIFAFSYFFPRREWIPGFSEYRAAIRKLDAVINSVLEERRRVGVDPEDRDLISYCLRAMEEDSGIMNDKQIRNELHTLLFAGSDTTANTLSWTFHLLSHRPEMMARCLQEADALRDHDGELSPALLNERLPYLTACVKETLRMYPPAPMLSRVCTKDTVLEGTRTLVSKGSMVTLDIWSVHRNPKHWVRPDEYRPERWLAEGEAEFGPILQEAFIPFGGGSRICIGMYFAIMEAQVIAAQVLQKVKFEPVPGFEPDAVMRMTLSSKNGIRLRALPRSSGDGRPSGQQTAATSV